MADEVKAENLGEYHKKFFEKKGAELGMDSSAFLKLTDPKKIEEIIEKYNDWVKEIENLSPDDQKNDGIEKDADYFNRKEEEISNMPQGTEEEKENHNKERANLSKEKEDAGWKKIQVGIALPNTPAMLKVYQYDPNDSTLKDMTEEELRDHFTEKFKKEMGLENSENDNKNAEPLNVSEGQEEDDNHQNDGDGRVDDDTEKYWKDWCDEKGYDYVRDPDTEKQGLAFSVKNNDRVKGNVHYKDNNNVVIGGEEGVADYEIFDALAKRAKDKNQVVNFQGEMTPEFKSRLMAACVLNGVNMMNQPKEKIEISAEWGLDEEAVKKIEEYNRKLEEQPERNEEQQDKNSFEDYKKLAEQQKKLGVKFNDDFFKEKSPAEQLKYFAAAKMAGAEVTWEPGYIDYSSAKKYDTDENGNKTLVDNPLYAELKDLPEEAKSVFSLNNQKVRSKQIEEMKKKKELAGVDKAGLAEKIKDGNLSDEEKLSAAKLLVRTITEEYKLNHGIDKAMTQEQAKEFFSELKGKPEFKDYAEAQALIYKARENTRSEEYKKTEHTDENGNKQTMDEIFKRKMQEYQSVK